MEKYVRARQGTNDNKIRRMRFACCMTKATNTTHSEYVILTAFPRQHCSRERPQLYVIRTLHVTCSLPPFERRYLSFSRTIFSSSVCCSTALVTPVSSASIVTSLLAEHPRNRNSVLDSSRHLSPLRNIRTVSGAPTVS